MKSNNRLWSIAGLFLSFLLVINASAETRYRVRYNDTLSHIVTRFYMPSRYSRAQIMVAILAKNPKAFRDGNINYLLRGKRLILPNDAEISQTSRADARELISQHARFFRSGISGLGLTAPPLNQGGDKKKTIEVVEKQTQKISALEEESNKLRKQLDNLVKQKQKRDKELKELEEKIKQYSLKEKSKPLGTVEQIEKRNQKLKETNEILQKKLIESKSDLAENARSTMKLQRKLSNLREEIDENKNAVASSATSSTAASELTSDDKGGFAKFKDKFYWVLPLMLLAALLYLLWLVARWFFARKKKVVEDYDDSDKDYATLIEEHDSLDYLNPENNNYEEESLEPSIKLDVARAYIEADDNDSALKILEEIMQEGTQEQVKEAKDILAYIKEMQ